MLFRKISRYMTQKANFFFEGGGWKSEGAFTTRGELMFFDTIIEKNSEKAFGLNRKNVQIFFDSKHMVFHKFSRYMTQITNFFWEGMGGLAICNHRRFDVF